MRVCVRVPASGGARSVCGSFPFSPPSPPSPLAPPAVAPGLLFPLAQPGAASSQTAEDGHRVKHPRARGRSLQAHGEPMLRDARAPPTPPPRTPASSTVHLTAARQGAPRACRPRHAARAICANNNASQTRFAAAPSSHRREPRLAHRKWVENLEAGTGSNVDRAGRIATPPVRGLGWARGHDGGMRNELRGPVLLAPRPRL